MSQLFAPQSRAQSTPERAALLSAGRSDSDTAPRAVEPLQKNLSVKSNASKPVRFHKTQFLALSAGVYGAAFADMHQTMYVRRFSWWTETDPLARPLVRLPAPAYYATGFALATGLNWLSWKMGHSRRWHRLAPIPQVLSIAGNTFGYRSNCYPHY